MREDQIQYLVQSLRHRGPDAQGYFVKQDVGLIHTRLSILELSELGAQPYFYKHLVLVYNGEIYNFKEIRQELIKSGYEFNSNGDTEVLIKAFHCWREACVDRFIGMFAFAVYDTITDELFLFRDRFGVKPLYYSSIGTNFYFASELKSFKVFGIPKNINLHALKLYFRFGYTPHETSIFESVSKLEPAHYLKVTRSGIKKTKYWHSSPELINDKTECRWVDELEELLVSAFSYRMVSDVPVGVFLSGGVDSSLLSAILQRHCGGIHTFTIGFSEKNFDESGFARQVAEKLGTEHTEKILTLPDARVLFEQFYSIYDEPFADTSGVPIACVTQLAKSRGMKVVLSADGGDELFGGYSHYLKAASLFSKITKIPQSIRSAMTNTSRVIIPRRLRTNIDVSNAEHRLYAMEELLSSRNILEFYEAYIANQSLGEVDNLVNGPPASSLYNFPESGEIINDMMSWDSGYYLPDDLLVKVDRATMHYGIESREPFLDHRIAEFCQRMPMNMKIRNGDQKYLLKKVLSRYLPAEMFERKKQGFSIPIFAWFNETLDKWFEIFFKEDVLKQAPFLNSKTIQTEYRKYKLYKQRGKQYNIEKMWRILSFLMWHSVHGK